MPDKEQSPSVTELCERLRAVEGVSEWGGAPDAPTTCYHRNPDGPEAAARIEALHAEREKLREALEGCDAYFEVLEHCGNEKHPAMRKMIRTALNASPKDSPDAT